jgi:hypothetical protein
VSYGIYLTGALPRFTPSAGRLSRKATREPPAPCGEGRQRPHRRPALQGIYASPLNLRRAKVHGRALPQQHSMPSLSRRRSGAMPLMAATEATAHQHLVTAGPPCAWHVIGSDVTNNPSCVSQQQCKKRTTMSTPVACIPVCAASATRRHAQLCRMARPVAQPYSGCWPPLSPSVPPCRSG